MTNKSGKGKTPTLLPQFVRWMDDLGAIGNAATQADTSKTHIQALNDEGSNALRSMAHDYATREGLINDSVKKSDLNGDEIKQYIGVRQAEDIRYATTLVHTSLDALVNDLDDKTIFKGAGDKDLAGFVASDGNRAWYALYQRVQGAKDLADRAKVGPGALKKEEREGIVKARGEEIRKAKYDSLLKRHNGDKHLANLGANAHLASFYAGSVEDEEDYLPEAAQAYAEGAEKVLRDYESSKKVSARTYVGEALKNLAERDVNKARDKLYGIAKN